MIRSLVFTTQGRLHSKDIDMFLMPVTVITTPLMMVGTWYGMNFKHMPELDWQYGYSAALALTLLSTLATYWYFRRKKWF